MSDLFPFATDYGTLVVFDPEILQHRVREKEGWWRRADLRDLEEVADGRIAIAPIGKEGSYRVSLCRELSEDQAALAVGRSRSQGLRVTSGEVFVGSAERLPGDARGARLSFIPDTGGLVQVEPGDYAVSIHVLRWRHDDDHYDEDGEIRPTAPADFVVLLAPRDGELELSEAFTPLLELLPKHEAKAKAKVSRPPVKRRGPSERTRRSRAPRGSGSSGRSAEPTIARAPVFVPEEVAPYSEEAVRAAFRDVLYSDLLDPPEMGPSVETLLLRPYDKGLLAAQISLTDVLRKTLRVREQMRVLEAKINGNKAMSFTEKAEFDTSITRVYESLDGLHGFLSGRIEEAAPEA